MPATYALTSLDPLDLAELSGSDAKDGATDAVVLGSLSYSILLWTNILQHNSKEVGLLLMRLLWSLVL